MIKKVSKSVAKRKAIQKKTVAKKVIDVWAKAKNYIGTKELKAVAMKLGAYNKYRGWEMPKGEVGTTPGYLVQYPDGYVSWSPKLQFETAYMTGTNLDFGAALFMLKAGCKVTRKGWNGKKMWITMSVGQGNLPAAKFWAPHNKAFAKANGGKADVEPFITMKTARGTIQMGWLATQSDMLANDWMIVE